MFFRDIPTALLFVMVVIASIAGVPALVAFVVTGSPDVARLAAYWSVFLIAEVFLVASLVVTFKNTRDEGLCFGAFMAAGILGALLAVCVCGHYSAVTGRHVQGQGLVFAKVALSAVAAGVACTAFASLRRAAEK